jgi:hypothetical protein
MSYGNGGGRNSGPKPLEEGRGKIAPSKNRKSDKSPHLVGRAKIDGREYYISAWHYPAKGDMDEAFMLAFESVEDAERRKNGSGGGDRDRRDGPQEARGGASGGSRYGGSYGSSSGRHDAPEGQQSRGSNTTRDDRAEERKKWDDKKRADEIPF